MGHMVEPSPQMGPIRWDPSTHSRRESAFRKCLSESLHPNLRSTRRSTRARAAGWKTKFSSSVPQKRNTVTWCNVHLSYIQIQRSLETGVRLAPCATLSVCLQVGSGVRAKISKSKGNVMLSRGILTHALQILRKRKKIHKLLYFECSPPDILFWHFIIHSDNLSGILSDSAHWDLEIRWGTSADAVADQAVVTWKIHHRRPQTVGGFTLKESMYFICWVGNQSTEHPDTTNISQCSVDQTSWPSERQCTGNFLGRIVLHRWSERLPRLWTQVDSHGCVTEQCSD